MGRLLGRSIRYILRWVVVVRVKKIGCWEVVVGGVWGRKF